ncbi:AMP-binding enzyme [Diaporthe sp. PMI_573]|nr:AMP-binding enzyme [Diaporthaceae sp. PMI_573]
MSHPQDEVHRQSLRDPESFWAKQAEYLYWHQKPTSVLEESVKSLRSGVEHPYWTWFGGGKISTCYNCVDRHVLAGRGDCPAIFYDSPVTGTKQTITYSQLLHEVEVFAAVLRDEGVEKGDVVLVYMPMIPAALIGILATSRLGAIHTVVFGGFAANALAQRIADAKPVVILTASCGIEGTKPPIDYKPLIKEAIEISGHRPKRTLIWQREQLSWRLDETDGEQDWFELARRARLRGVKAECVPVDSNDAVYIIFTSGTTGSPKGVVRDAGGHAVGLQFSIRYTFGIHGPGDVMFAASDIGWIVGHSYVIYGPLLAGAATVLYEGKPVGTPDSSSFWRIIRDYKVNSIFMAPRDDPEKRYLKRIGSTGGLKSLKGLFLGGERSGVTLVALYQQLLQRYGAPGARINDNWWSSETGSPITAISLSPEAAIDGKNSVRGHLPLVNVKPGSAGKLMPGFDIKVVDDQGGKRFYTGYLRRFGKWIDTGDTGTIHEDGYISVLSRSDDVINTAGHRLSTGIIEQAITSHPLVAEASVVGIPDALKGQLPFAFVTLSTTDHPPSAIPDQRLTNDIQKRVREQVGGIATLGGIIQGKGIIPKTRSGKTLRRVLKELIENAVHGEFGKDIVWPATIEDVSTVETAKGKIEEYFRIKGSRHKAIEAPARL